MTTARKSSALEGRARRRMARGTASPGAVGPAADPSEWSSTSERAASMAAAPRRPLIISPTWGATLRLQRRVHAARAEGPLRPRLVALPAPAIAMDRVSAGLAWRPHRALLLGAFVMACGVHALFADWSLGLRPHKAKARPVEMTVAAPVEEPVVEDVVPEPAAEPTTQASATGPSRDTQTTSSPASARPTGPVGPPAPFGLGGGLGDALGGGFGSGSGGGVPVGAAGPARGNTGADASPSAPPTQATPPRALRRPPPDYPRRARTQQVEGYVALQLLVGVDGAVRDVRVVESAPKGIFEDAAVAAVRRWSFAPARNNGAAVEAWVRQTVRFTLSSS